METLKKLILKLWNWLKDQTEIDEKIEEKVDDIKEDFDDVAKAVGGSKRKGKKPSTTKITKSALRVMKKAELLKTAKKEFKIDLDSKLTKSNLVNKVYELYHKK